MRVYESWMEDPQKSISAGHITDDNITDDNTTNDNITDDNTTHSPKKPGLFLLSFKI